MTDDRSKLPPIPEPPKKPRRRQNYRRIGALQDALKATQDELTHVRDALQQAHETIADLEQRNANQDDLRKALTDEYPAVTVDTMPTVLWFALLAVVFTGVMAFVVGAKYAGGQ